MWPGSECMWHIKRALHFVTSNMAAMLTYNRHRWRAFCMSMLSSHCRFVWGLTTVLRKDIWKEEKKTPFEWVIRSAKSIHSLFNPLILRVAGVLEPIKDCFKKKYIERRLLEPSVPDLGSMTTCHITQPVWFCSFTVLCLHSHTVQLLSKVLFAKGGHLSVYHSSRKTKKHAVSINNSSFS